MTDQDGNTGPAPSGPLVFTPEPPLRTDPGGVVRVGRGRVSLDLVVGEYNRGKSPEEIARAYDALQLADVHAAIAYYLRHREEVDAYLARREAEADRWKAKVEGEHPRI